jgi:hypothetical protein
MNTCQKEQKHEQNLFGDRGQYFTVLVAPKDYLGSFKKRAAETNSLGRSQAGAIKLLGVFKVHPEQGLLGLSF